MRIHYLQHVPFEGLGCIEVWARDTRHQLSGTRLFQNDLPPEAQDIDWLVVMGGPMGAGDEKQYPWLALEKRLIAKAILQGKTVLGICLGAQLIADVLGARVYPNLYREIGWFPIELTEAGIRSSLLGFLPPHFKALHWHGDTFDLPRGAIHLARSQACEHQAFVYAERAVGLQFHLELGFENVKELIRNCAEELVEGQAIQNPSQMLAKAEDFRLANQAMETILTRLSQLNLP